MKKYIQIQEAYIEESDKSLMRHLLPEYYTEQNIDNNNIGMDYAARFLQNQLNSVLNSFINGGFSYKGFIFYPLIRDVSKANIKKMQILEKTAVFLNNNGYSFPNSVTKSNRKINETNFALMLSAMYQGLSLIKNKNCAPVKKFKCNELGMGSYRKADLGYLKPLKDLKDYANKNLRKYLSGFYLHGSLATKDYVKGWSDVDTLSVISKETLSSPARLLELRDRMYYMRHFFYRIDPLQHHGSIAISEYDLDNYCQAYFPIPIFNHAKSFFKDDEISKFRVRNFSSEAINKMFWFVSYFRKLNAKKEFNLGSYDLKTLLHAVTLFPTIYLQSKGILVYKKFSFGIAKKYFKKGSWRVIDQVSTVRSNWKQAAAIPSIGLFSRINPLLCYQLNSRVADLFSDIKNSNNIDVEKIAEGMLMLSEEAWNEVKQNAKNRSL